MKSIVLFVLAGLAAPAVWAQDAAPASQNEDSLQILVQQQQEIKADLDDGGIDGLTPRENNLVRKAQTEFFTIVDGKSKLDDLSIDEKVRVENALERINAQVQNTRQASGDQQVCWREKTSGSTIKKTRCGSQDEITHAREGARGYLERPRVCVPPGCGGAN